MCGKGVSGLKFLKSAGKGWYNRFCDYRKVIYRVLATFEKMNSLYWIELVLNDTQAPMLTEMTVYNDA
jgi:hypothetical protein